MTPSLANPPAPAQPDPAAPANLSPEQQRHAAMTAVEAVDEYIRIKLKARGNGDDAVIAGKGTKIASEGLGHGRRRQFRAAAFLYSEEIQKFGATFPTLRIEIAGIPWSFPRQRGNS